MANGELRCGHAGLAALVPVVVIGALGFGLLLALSPGAGFGPGGLAANAAAILGASSFAAGLLLFLWILLLILGGIVFLLRQPAAIVKWLLERFPALKVFLRGVRDGGKLMETGGAAAETALDTAAAGLRKAVEELRVLASSNAQTWTIVAALPDDPVTGPLRDGVNKAREGINTAMSGLEDARTQLLALARQQKDAGTNLKTAAETLDPTLVGT